jgi:hypothetical protein
MNKKYNTYASDHILQYNNKQINQYEDANIFI